MRNIKFNHEEQEYTLIDTAGIRRKKSEHAVVDKFAAIRTKRAIERSDVCVLMLDAQRGLTTQEKQIASDIEEAGKCCVLFFNKWDLVKGHRMEHCLGSIRNEALFLNYCPALFGSALTTRNLDKLFPLINEAYQFGKTRITTHRLNTFIINTLQKTSPPMINGKRLRVYYMAQVAVQPPTFVLFINYASRMSTSYQRYIYNQMREKYKFTGAPLVLRLKEKRSMQQT